jgi:hypothetical protein
MKIARFALVAFTAAVGFAVLAAPAPASATDWSWLSNKNYISCLQLYGTGNFGMPSNLTPRSPHVQPHLLRPRLRFPSRSS